MAEAVSIAPARTQMIPVPTRPLKLRGFSSSRGPLMRFRIRARRVSLMKQPYAARTSDVFPTGRLH